MQLKLKKNANADGQKTWNLTSSLELTAISKTRWERKREKERERFQKSELCPKFSLRRSVDGITLKLFCMYMYLYLPLSSRLYVYISVCVCVCVFLGVGNREGVGVGVVKQARIARQATDHDKHFLLFILVILFSFGRLCPW